MSSRVVMFSAAAAIAAVVSGVSGLAGSAAPAQAGSWSKLYAIGGGDGAVTCALDAASSSAPGINGVCDTAAGPGTFDVMIADATGQKVNAVMSFRDSTSANLPDAPVPFCNEIKGFKMPPNGTQIFIRIGVVGRTGGDPTGLDPTGILPQGTPAATMACGAPTAPTEGTVTITGSSVTAPAAAAAPSLSRRSTVAATAVWSSPRRVAGPTEL